MEIGCRTNRAWSIRSSSHSPAFWLMVWGQLGLHFVSFLVAGATSLRGLQVPDGYKINPHLLLLHLLHLLFLVRLWSWPWQKEHLDVLTNQPLNGARKMCLNWWAEVTFCCYTGKHVPDLLSNKWQTCYIKDYKACNGAKECRLEQLILNSLRKIVLYRV